MELATHFYYRFSSFFFKAEYKLKTQRGKLFSCIKALFMVMIFTIQFSPWKLKNILIFQFNARGGNGLKFCAHALFVAKRSLTCFANSVKSRSINHAVIYPFAVWEWRASAYNSAKKGVCAHNISMGGRRSLLCTLWLSTNNKTSGRNSVSPRGLMLFNKIMNCRTLARSRRECDTRVTCSKNAAGRVPAQKYY